MASAAKNTQGNVVSQADFQAVLKERIREGVRQTIETILDEELDAFVGAGRYQRTGNRRDQRNGHYTRDLSTNFGLIEDLEVPRSRQGFQTQVFDRYQRRQTELDQSIGEMYIRGVSTRGVGDVVEALTGMKPSASTVSRIFHTLEDEYDTWKKRPLAAHYRYAFADGTYFTVKYENEGCKMPILAIIGIRDDGTREMLAFSTGDRENQVAWTDLVQDIKSRGVATVDLWITDGNQAMIGAIDAKFRESQRQRCVVHKIENVLGYVPKQQQEAVKPELKAIFYQDSRLQAEQVAAAFCAKFEKAYPTAIDCLKRDLDACLTFYAFPKVNWRTIRSSNVIERFFLEAKRRYHKMGAAYPNENSCLLTFYAIVRTVKFHKVTMPTKDTAK